MWFLLAACAPDPKPPREVGAVQAPIPAPGVPARVEIAVDLTDPASGSARVVMTLRDADPRDLAFKHLDGDGYELSEVHLQDAAGRELRVTRDGRVFRPPPGVGGDLSLSWRVAPGGLGRHGHQGFVGPDFAVLDGRAWLVPQTRNPVEEVRFRFTLPDGWRVASSLRAEPDGAYVMEAYGGSLFLLQRLRKECLGLGPFELHEATAGSTPLRVWVHPGISEVDGARIVSDTVAEHHFFHDELGFDPGYPLSFVRTPRAPGEEGRIFGGASMTGACWEDVHPTRPVRNELLLGHRFAHPFNRYVPSGLTPRDLGDAWFTEGWAGYVEVVAQDHVGSLGSEGYFTTLFHQHLERLHEHPDWDLALSAQPRVTGEQVEYVDYVRAPLAVRLLAHLVAERSDTTLEAFVRDLWARHGRHQGAFGLQEELEAFTGEDYDDFFAAVVQAPGPIAPTWPGYTDALAPSEAPPALRAGGVGFSGDYLHFLARTGDFERFGQIRDFVAREGPRRRALAQAGVTLAHRDVLDRVERLAPAVRYELAKAEAHWPLHATPGESLELVAEDPDGRAFLELLEAEGAYDAARGSSGVTALEVRTGTGEQAEGRAPALGFPPGDPVVLYTSWQGTPGLTTFEALAEGAPRHASEVLVEAGWDRTRVSFAPSERSDRPVVSFRVRSSGAPPVTRAFWQRAVVGPDRPVVADPPPPWAR